MKRESTYAVQIKLGLIAAIVVAFCMLVSDCLGQTQTQREYNSRAHKYQTEFNGMELNFVNVRVQNFLQQQMTMAQSVDPVYDFKDSIIFITEDYSSEEYKFSIRYTCRGVGNKLYIESAFISGTRLKVIDFFVNFWETSLNFATAKKDETVVSYFISDRIALSISPSRNYAEIEIREN